MSTAPLATTTEPDLIARQRTVLRQLHELIAERARTEPDAERAFRTQRGAIVREFEESFQSAIVRFATEKETIEREKTEALAAAHARFDAEKEAARREIGAARQKTVVLRGEDKEAARAAFNEARWSLAAELEGGQQEAQEEYKQIQLQLEEQMRLLAGVHEEARELLRRWKYKPRPLPPAEKDSQRAADHRKIVACIRDAQVQLAQLRELTVPRWVHGVRLPLAFLVMWLVALVPLLFLFFGDWWWYLGGIVPISLVSAIGLFGFARTILAVVARSQIRDAYRPLAEAVRDAEASRRKVLAHYEARREKTEGELKHRHDAGLRLAHRKYKEQRAAIRAQRLSELQLAQRRYQQRKIANAQKLAEETRQIEENARRRLAEIQQRFDARTQQVHERRDRKLADLEGRFEHQLDTLTSDWDQAQASLCAAAADIHRQARQLFPDWTTLTQGDKPAAAEVPRYLRLGEYRVYIPDERDHTTSVDLLLPALVPFPDRGALLLEAADDGRARAVEALQAVMYRLLIALPPGKVRFTIVDPVGLGENFAEFMHLADHDEALVGSRIWTEAAHIEQRLTDLTAHMENVIQKYLRNQYRSITEYNAQAGEVAEPFRFLVAANFPAGFTQEAARRLLSIAQAGARCGVFTLVSVDGKLPLPKDFALADLQRASVTLRWQGERFAWDDPDLGRYPLKLDAPPAAEVGLALLQKVGEQAKAAGKVEVPFEFIAPPPEQWWTGDSRSGLVVPLGRAGATKRQSLKLGQGTSQHVLVAGKTGSGKSTLLHALIANLALTYSPEEVELYLIDFKKGVEFKTYAAHELPHAKVVAIESEREFGLSVLQRLDQELKQRGERFRAAGVQDIAGYRNANGGTMPRILLIVDEFQEFFVEDDRLAQDAAQLLDRLVRQGRAFGLHVLLGSQTLGGAYSLARSTIDQMAVRIALQCSEADAHLILSDDNSAARLLGRPGEAIYNDANGLVEGNNPFQIVWLPEAKREEYLEKIHALARERLAAVPAPLVFEGNAPADAAKNPLLDRLLREPPAAAPRALAAWLGEAVAIKDPTAATFRRQAGSNLLVVGQQDEAALGMLTTALIGLAAQAPDAVFCVLDGTPADAPHAGFLQRLPEVLPQTVKLAGLRTLPALMTEVAAEVARRQQGGDGEVGPPWFLLIYGLQRFRDLRKPEDDFGFMRKPDEPPNPAQHLATLLREGSPLGVHVLAWCDTLNNVTRCLDRAMLREFEMRVLFQMSVADSSNLIDTPLASKLGVHRALFHSEEQGKLEKFRPYAVPPNEWLTTVTACLARPRRLAAQVNP